MALPECKLSPRAIMQLKNLGFTNGVMIIRDVSVRGPGAVEAVFRSSGDAKKFASALNKVYGAGSYGEFRL